MPIQLGHLSAEQLAIVRHEGPDHLLVMADPGSGKTRVIAERVAYLIERQNVDPHEIVAVTFSRRAAHELRARIESPSVLADTFHGTCATILRRHGKGIGLNTSFLIADESRQHELISAVAAAQGFRVTDYDAGSVRDINHAISAAKRRLWGEDFRHAATPAMFASSPFPRAYLEIARAYEEARLAANLLDFDDLIGHTTRLLREDLVSVDAIRAGCRYLFVDEFHDVSDDQSALIRLLMPPRTAYVRSDWEPQPGPPHAGQLMVVADQNQAIYGFRGANAQRAIRDFRRDYRPIARSLSHNYRCPPRVTRPAEAALRQPRTASPHDPTADSRGPVRCMRFETSAEEARQIAKWVRLAIDERGIPPGDIAILYRHHNRVDTIEDALIAEGVSIWRTAPDRPFDDPDLKEVLRAASLAITLHDQHLERALNWPRVLIDELEMINLRRLALDNNLRLVDLAECANQFRDTLSPLTIWTIMSFLTTLREEIVPFVDEPMDRLGERLLEIIHRPRSVFSAADRADINGPHRRMATSLTGHTRHLLTALRASRPVHIIRDNSRDSLAAAIILEHLVTQYWALPVVIKSPTDRVSSEVNAFVIRLGAPDQVHDDGCSLDRQIVRIAGEAIEYNLAVRAWHLGQQVLMAAERSREGAYCALDVETTSKQHDRTEIVQIAAVPFRLRRDADQTLRAEIETSWSALVRPTGPGALSQAAVEVHGITWDMLRHQSEIAAVLPSAIERIGSRPVVGHNVEQFDLPIVRRFARQCNLAEPGNEPIDTLAMTQRLFPRQPSKLGEICQLLAIPLTQAHDAGKDATASAHLLAKLVDHLDQERELDLLPDLLPVVAATILTDTQSARYELAVVARAGSRAYHRGHGRDILERWQACCPKSFQQFTSDTSSHDDDDPRWQKVTSTWRRLIHTYLSTNPKPGLHDFLTYCALANPLDVVPDPTPSETATGAPGAWLPAIDRVTLMTFHSAKGQEWPLVFLVGCEDGSIPSWFASKNGPDPSAMDEERRILYVRITRAKQHLVLTWTASNHGHAKPISRFLDQLPISVLKR